MLRLVGISVAAFCVLAIAFLLINPAGTRSLVLQAEASFRETVLGQNRNLREKWSRAFGAYLRRSEDGIDDVPTIHIDVPFKGMRKIYEKREVALWRGHLVQGDDDFVKGSIRFGDATVPVKLRLKGDWTDHLEGQKWSFRIRTRDDHSIFGMRRFSIQNPAVRGYQAEPMFFAVQRYFGVMTPRYFIVNVVINGEDLGLMAVEEFFSKELIESNRRREGVIVRFDESLVWSSNDSLEHVEVGFFGAFDNYRNAEVDAFGSSRVAETPTLNAQFEAAAGLLRGFADGDVPASEVFDATQLGRYIAVCDALGSWHAVGWINLRFYMNPITMKLEPIAFDGTLQDGYKGLRSIVNNEQFVIAALDDPLVWSAYTETLDELLSMLDDGSLVDMLRASEERLLPTLQTEFRSLESYRLDYLDLRIRDLHQRMTTPGAQDKRNRYFERQNEQRLYPQLAHFRLAPNRRTVVIENAIPFEVDVTGAHWVHPETGDSMPAAIDGLPLELAPRGIGTAGTRRTLDVSNPPATAEWILEFDTRMRGRPWELSTAAKVKPAPLHESPVPKVTTENFESKHPFAAIDHAARRVTIEPGDWAVDGDFITPQGYGVRIGPGTSLRFAPGAIMVVRGPLEAIGDDESPIRFTAAAQAGWGGLAVIQANTRSMLRNAIVETTTGVRSDTWTLTGGVNFYRSDVDIASSLLTGNRGEDALNIIESNFRLTDIEIRDTASDAFDSDFSTGSVEGGLFANIGRAGGGDGIDISGSDLRIDGTRLQNVSDKALSVGEASRMTASSVVIENVGTGAAAKDGSTLEISDSLVADAEFAALTAYTKKSEYGPAGIVASGVEIRRAANATIAQNGSSIRVDGVEAETRDVDVDELYATIMKKGLQ